MKIDEFIKSFYIKKYKELALLLTTVLVTSLIIVTSFEIFLGAKDRKYHEFMNLKYKEREMCETSSSDSTLIYEFKPNRCGMNSNGYFDEDHNFSKSNGTFRIVIIGDSVAQGSGLESYRESFGKILEDSLNKQLRSWRFETVILARGGYSTVQELTILKKEAFKYNPDLIIWSYVLNDPAHPLYHNANNEAGRYFFKPKSYFTNYVSMKLFFIKEKLNSRECNLDPDYFLHCVYWPNIKSNIGEIGKISKEKNTKIIFLIHPTFLKSGFNNYSLKIYHQKLVSVATADGLIAYDLLEEFSKYKSSEIKQNPTNWYDPWHPNKKGHEIIGKYLARRLANEILNNP
ncbi:MAG: SGNH/GDSL hydrolase family protein [Nanoarchaeota archaeon]